MSIPQMQSQPDGQLVVIGEVTARIDKQKNVLKPDDDGFYTDFPLAVLDQVSENRTLYKSAPFIDKITNPSSSFYHRLVNGVLIGEYNHPNIIGMSKHEAIARTLLIESNLEGVFFRKISVKAVGNAKIVFGDLKPSGPKKALVQEKLDDPNINLAFSLRSLTKDKRHPKGYIEKSVSILVTFDVGMAGGGFAQASKTFKTQAGVVYLGNEQFTPEGFTLGYEDYHHTEQYGIPICPDDICNIMKQENLGYEDLFTTTELKSVFGVKKIIINGELKGFLMPNRMVVMGDKLPKELVPLEQVKSTFKLFSSL